MKDISPANDEERLMCAQGHALRSWAYWNLIQAYAPNYSIDPSAKAIPIYDKDVTLDFFDTTRHEAATAQEVYDLMLNDINTAISYLSDNKLNPAHIN